MRFGVALAAGGVVLGTAWPRVCLAQLDASLDAGASYVKYDQFLGSGAVSFTPSVTYASPRAWLSSRATILVFESRRTSLQGMLTGGAWSPAFGPIRAEATAEGGASSYAGFARFQHVVGAVRLHALGRRRGAWAGPSRGQIATAMSAHVRGVSAGAWSRVPAGGALSVIVSRMRVGDTAYSDAEARWRWQPGRLDLEAAIGTRFASRRAGHGAYGDVSAAFAVTPRTQLVIAGGRYPSDPLRGSIPGGYLMAGVKLRPRPAVRAAVVRGISARVAAVIMAMQPPGDRAMRLSIEVLEGLYVLSVHAPGAKRVELMGDFTDWLPLPLVRTAEGRFEFAVRLPVGTHRFNVRLDGAAWSVPGGVDSADDEFGGRAAVLVVP